MQALSKAVTSKISTEHLASVTLDGARTGAYVRFMCDLSRDEQGALAALLGDLQAAEARMSATYPEVFSRAWAEHEAMLASLDD